jgi:hypothetical protein
MLAGLWDSDKPLAGRELPKEKAAALVRKYPQDFPLQLRWQIVNSSSSAPSPEEDPDRTECALPLLSTFSENPSLYAFFLRHLSHQRVSLDRFETGLLDSNSGMNREKSWSPPTMEELQKRKSDAYLLLSYARTGELLDPQNAFFPMMVAVGHFVLRQDKEATAAILRASRKTEYRDYAADEWTGAWRYNSLTMGEVGTAMHIFEDPSSVYYHGNLHDTIRLAVVKAVQQEQAGDTEEGFRIRQALARWMGILRVGEKVGTARMAMRTVCLRPGGAPFQERKPEHDYHAENKDAYLAYLKRIGHPEEAAFIESEFAVQQRIYEIWDQQSDKSVQYTMQTKLGYGWAVGFGLLLNLFWVLNFGLFARLLARSRWFQVRRGKSVTPDDWKHFWKTLGVLTIHLLLLGVFGASLVASTRNTLSDTVAALLVVGGTGCLSAYLYLLISKRFRSLMQLAFPPVIALLIVGIVPVAASFAALPARCVVASYIRGFCNYGGYAVDETLWERITGYMADPMTTAISLAVPLALLIVTGIIALCKRTPLLSGLIDGMKRTALPAATVLLFLYAASIVGLAKWEALLTAEVRYQIAHPDSYYTHFAGEAWPGFSPGQQIRNRED